MKSSLHVVLCVLLICACSSLGWSQSNSNSSNQSNQSEEKVYKPSEVTKGVKIISKPRGEYTPEALKNEVSGTVILRVTFLSSGKLTNIGLASGLPDGLSEKAKEAAQKIKFRPAEIDGRPVSVRMNIEIEFKAPY
jgi:TonB family protein